jgi:RimJ/RimL family protein N-acetyltransferase
MLIEVPSDAREPLRPLFAGFPGLHGLIDILCEGAMGDAWADDPTRPSVALLQLDFNILAGDADASAAEEAVRRLMPPPVGIVTTSRAWEPLLGRVFGEPLGTRQRVGFSSDTWDRERLGGFIDALPPGFDLRRIDGSNVSRFEEMNDAFVYNFDSLEDYLARGVGYGVEHEGRFVSGCSSFAIGSRSLEFEIETHEDYRGRDLATACAAAMILHCLDHGLEPCWDAHNEISAALATKLGFTNPKPYIVYEIGL